jgi:hypothetical protein
MDSGYVQRVGIQLLDGPGSPSPDVNPRMPAPSNSEAIFRTFQCGFRDSTRRP